MFVIETPDVASIGGTLIWRGPATEIHCDLQPAERSCCGPVGYADRGVVMDFANGFALSIRWGTRNDCDASGDARTLVSETAEIAVCNRYGKVLGLPLPHATAAEALALIPIVAGLASTHEIVSCSRLLYENQADSTVALDGLDANKVSLLLGALHNMPTDTFSLADSADRSLLMKALTKLEERIS